MTEKVDSLITRMDERSPFDKSALLTVHDILEAWSLGQITDGDAISMMELDGELELYAAALDNGIPLPAKASANQSMPRSD